VRSRSSLSASLIESPAGIATWATRRPHPAAADTSMTKTSSNAPPANCPGSARFNARCTCRHSCRVFCSIRRPRSPCRCSVSSRALSNSESNNPDATSRSRVRFDTTIVSLGRTRLTHALARQSCARVRKSRQLVWLKLWEPARRTGEITGGRTGSTAARGQLQT